MLKKADLKVPTLSKAFGVFADIYIHSIY
jgi:hypothetical protein